MNKKYLVVGFISGFILTLIPLLRLLSITYCTYGGIGARSCPQGLEALQISLQTMIKIKPILIVYLFLFVVAGGFVGLFVGWIYGKLKNKNA